MRIIVRRDRESPTFRPIAVVGVAAVVRREKSDTTVSLVVVYTSR